MTNNWKNFDLIFFILLLIHTKMFIINFHQKSDKTYRFSNLLLTSFNNENRGEDVLLKLSDIFRNSITQNVDTV